MRSRLRVLEANDHYMSAVLIFLPTKAFQELIGRDVSSALRSSPRRILERDEAKSQLLSRSGFIRSELLRDVFFPNNAISPVPLKHHFIFIIAYDFNHYSLFMPA